VDDVNSLRDQLNESVAECHRLKVLCTSSQWLTDEEVAALVEARDRYALPPRLANTINSILARLGGHG